MKKLVVMVLSIVVLSSLVLVGCSSSKKEASMLDKIKEKGKLVVGTSADYPPYEFHKMSDGKDEIMGMDIEIAKAIAKDLGVELEVVDINFKGLISAMKSGKIDMILAGMNENEERAKSVDFSDIYYKENQTIVVRKDELENLQTKEAFAQKSVGAQTGTIQEEFVDKELTESEKVSLAKIPELIIALQAKKIDGVVLPIPVAESYVENNPDLVLTPLEFDITGGVSVAMPKDSPELVEAVNKTLENLKKEDQISKWFAEYDKIANEE